MTTENILDEANRITSGARNEAYGSPLDNHTTTATLWTEYLLRKYGNCHRLDADDVCMLNILQKISRHANAPKRDNLVDIAGYARNSEMVDVERQRRENKGVPNGLRETT